MLGAFVSRIFEENKAKEYFFTFANFEISIFDTILALFTIIVMAVINNQRQRGFAGFSFVGTATISKFINQHNFAIFSFTFHEDSHA